MSPEIAGPGDLGRYQRSSNLLPSPRTPPFGSGRPRAGRGPTSALTGEYVDSPSAQRSRRDSSDPTPLVSICVPTYNGARFLSQCLDTALAQTWTDFELVIVDDRSSDGTFAIAAAYAARDSRVKLHQNDRNLGLAGNWNRCVLLSQGQWIKFLFQDDLLEPTRLARMLAVRRSDTPLIAVRRALAIESETPESITR